MMDNQQLRNNTVNFCERRCLFYLSCPSLARCNCALAKYALTRPLFAHRLTNLFRFLMVLPLCLDFTQYTQRLNSPGAVPNYSHTPYQHGGFGCRRSGI
jgi:hypothetical protein